MGHGIAQISAMSGYEVLAIETNDAALNVGIARCSPLFFDIQAFISIFSFCVVVVRACYCDLISTLLTSVFYFHFLVVSISSFHLFSSSLLRFHLYSSLLTTPRHTTHPSFSYLPAPYVFFSLHNLFNFPYNFRIENSLGKALSKEVAKGKLTEVKQKTM